MSKNAAVRLTATKIIFYSEHDEASFFEWLNKLKCLDKLEGAGSDLYLYINVTKVDKYDLLELLALFRRYEIPMQQLIAFDQKKFTKWFRDKRAYWYSTIFLSDENT